MGTSVIRPGILVSLKSTVAGGVAYRRRDLDAGTLESGAAMQRWETEKTVVDPEEHDRAGKVRSKALGAVRKVCSASAFGLLCPLESEAALDAAVREARAAVAEFNATAKYTQVGVFCLKGRIASTDEEAARAIGSEVASLIGAMNGAIDRLDADAIREAANKAKAISAMLSDEQGEKIGEAIKQARAAARAIVSRVEGKGEAAAVVLADIQRGALERARIAFLDIDAPAEVAGEAMPLASPQRVASLDLDSCACDADPRINPGDCPGETGDDDDGDTSVRDLPESSERGGETLAASGT